LRTFQLVKLRVGHPAEQDRNRAKDSAALASRAQELEATKKLLASEKEKNKVDEQVDLPKS
jgi:hypothetical protein